MRKFLATVVCICFVIFLSAQQSIDVYPTNWWVGMKNPKVQLLIHSTNIAGAGLRKVTTNYTGVKVVNTEKVENNNYLIANLEISANAEPGKITFQVKNADALISSFDFELKPRRAGKGTQYAQGVRSSDFIYLLMPDRFSNGDYSNDKITGYKDQSLDRSKMYDRHGGDIQGVTNHLDYLKDLGATAVWMTPVLENDMKYRTEHGYAITNHYKVDARLGGDVAYKTLSDSLHKRGMKLIQDAVYNHAGLYHFFIEDLPSKDWIHQWPTFTHPNYKDQTLFDPHVAQADKKLQLDGWFDKVMPDLNQNNPYLANFLIQHALWCVEEFGLDGWRIDTYIYNDLNFMNRCNQALLDEYPKLTMFGEAWVGNTANQAFFARNTVNTKFKSNLIGVKDFQLLFDGIYPAVKDGNCNRMYQVLSNDFLYADPMTNVIFLDNHDITRFLSEVGEDLAKLKMGIGWLLTERGIPQLYYGTEILLKGVKNPDGLVRGDFIGGWKEDAQNKFTQQGRTDAENDVFTWTRTLANFRRNSSAIKTGKLMQFVPEDKVYTYFRYDDKQTVMIVMNTSNDEKTIKPERFLEITKGFTKAKNVALGWTADLTVPEWKVPGKTIWVLELGK